MTRYAENKPKTTIRITAEGKCKVRPDTVRLEVGLLSYGETFQEAKVALDEKIKELMDEVQNTGYDYGHYRADNLIHNEATSNPYNFIDKEMAGKHELCQGFRWEFPIGNAALEALCKICEKHVPDEGIQLVYGCEHRTEYRDRAIKQALKEARTHVETLAQETGLKVGKINSIEVSPETLDRWHNIYDVRHYTIFLHSGRINPHFFPPDHILTEHILVEWELHHKDT